MLNLYSVCELEGKKISEEAKISVSAVPLTKAAFVSQVVDRFSTRTEPLVVACTRPSELCD